MHFRSLEALGERLQEEYVIDLYKSKLPSEALFTLELQRDTETWTFASFREKLKRYIKALQCESFNKPINQPFTKPNETRTPFKQPSFQPSSYKPRPNFSTGHALVTNQTESFPASTSTQYSNPSLTARNKGCVYCKGEHWSDECDKYSTVDARKEKIWGSCFGCLKSGHSLNECPSQKICIHCQTVGKHHRSLCPKKFGNASAQGHSNRSSSRHPNFQRNKNEFQHGMIASTTSTSTLKSQVSPNGNNQTVHLLAAGEAVLMQTAKAVVRDLSLNHSVETRALFDSGSQRSYITENLAKQLELTPVDVEGLQLCTFGTKEITQIPSQVVDLEVRTLNNKSVRMRLNTTPCITRDLKRTSLPSSIDPAQFDSVHLADNYFSAESEYSIELLIGNDYYFKFILPDRRIVRDGLYLINTRLGWMLTGRVERDSPPDPNLTECTLALANSRVLPREQTLLSKESLPLKKAGQMVEHKIENQFSSECPTIHASISTNFATQCETSIPEESLESTQSPEQIRISPFRNPSFPTFRAARVPIDVKFLNGVRKRSPPSFFDGYQSRSAPSPRFGSSPLLHERRVVFNDPGLPPRTPRELDLTPRQEFDRKDGNRTKVGRMSAWAQRIPLRIETGECARQTLLAGVSRNASV